MSEVVILAGDTHIKGRGIDLARALFPHKPVIMVAGNHEFYGGNYQEELQRLRDQAAAYSEIHMLENDEVEIEGVVFLGCCLWTDCRLWEKGPYQGRYDYHETVREVGQCLHDYSRITWGSDHRLLKVQDTINIHKKSLAWLEKRLLAYRGQGRKVVVVTHHGPSYHSIHPAFAHDIASAAFVSYLDPLVKRCGAALWVHGHTHFGFDYVLGDTRVLANAKGYPMEEDLVKFRPELIVGV